MRLRRYTDRQRVRITKALVNGALCRSDRVRPTSSAVPRVQNRCEWPKLCQYLIQLPRYKYPLPHPYRPHCSVHARPVVSAIRALRTRCTHSRGRQYAARWRLPRGDSEHPPVRGSRVPRPGVCHVPRAALFGAVRVTAAPLKSLCAAAATGSVPAAVAATRCGVSDALPAPCLLSGLSSCLFIAAASPLPAPYCFHLLLRTTPPTAHAVRGRRRGSGAGGRSLPLWPPRVITTPARVRTQFVLTVFVLTGGVFVDGVSPAGEWP